MDKIPGMKPKWTGGNSLVVDGELLGYFKQFMSAWRWRKYLVATGDVKEAYIQYRGKTVNIWKKENDNVV
jgi:hypothetical protein